MNEADYIKYQSCGLAEYSADLPKFSLYVQYMSTKGLKTKLLSLLNVLLDYYTQTPPDKRFKVLKIKEIISVFLIYADLDSSVSSIILSWKYNLILLKNLFDFAYVYSNKRVAARNIGKISKLINFIIFDHYLQEENGADEFSTAEVAYAERVVRSTFEGEIKEGTSDEIEEKTHAGILYGKKALMERDKDIGMIIELLKKLIENYQERIANIEILGKARLLISTYKALAESMDKPEDSFEKLMQIPVMQPSEPMILENLNEEQIFDLPIDRRNRINDEAKLALLGSNYTLKYSSIVNI